MNILIVNDDGIDSIGIRILCEVIIEKTDWSIYVFAPDVEKSASAAAMSLHKELSIVENKEFKGVEKAFSVIGGFPVDCSKIAFSFLKDTFDISPDMIISGINNGENTGIDLRYSGTVNAAFEGLERKIPSFALSLAMVKKDDVEGFYRAASFLVEYIIDNKENLRTDILYNFNYPDLDNIKGVKETHPAEFFYKEYYLFEKKKKNGQYRAILKGERVFEKDDSPDSDLGAVANGYVSLTKLKPEFLYEK